MFYCHPRSGGNLLDPCLHGDDTYPLYNTKIKNMQKFLSMIIAVGILYYLAGLSNEDSVLNLGTSKEKGASEQPKDDKEPEPLAGNFLEKTLSKILVGVLKTEEGRAFFENILQPQNGQVINSDQGFKINNLHFISSMFNMTTTGEGKDGPASCGHIVTVRYQILTPGGVPLEEETKTFTLGSRKVMPGLDNVIVGMRVGQTRKADIPAKYAFSQEKYRRQGIDNDSPYRVIVTLQEILPANFAKEDEVRIFDDEIAYKVPLLCGDCVSFDAKITRLASGEVLYDTEPSGRKVSLNIGDISYPMIFSHALYGKIPVGTRAVIAKGSTFRSFGMSTSKTFPQKPPPANEYYLLELLNFEEGN